MVALRGRTRDDMGAAAVEMALVMPFLLLLVLGIIDFGRMYSMQISLTQGAREGARVAALPPYDTAAASQRALDAAWPYDDATVTPSSTCPGTDAEIRVSRTYDYITPIQGLLSAIGQPALATPTITGRGRMRCNG